MLVREVSISRSTEERKEGTVLLLLKQLFLLQTSFEQLLLLGSGSGAHRKHSATAVPTAAHSLYQLRLETAQCLPPWAGVLFLCFVACCAGYRSTVPLWALLGQSAEEISYSLNRAEHFIGVLPTESLLFIFYQKSGPGGMPEGADIRTVQHR